MFSSYASHRVNVLGVPNFRFFSVYVLDFFIFSRIALEFYIVSN